MGFKMVFERKLMHVTSTDFDLSDSFLETTSPDPNNLFFTTEA